MGEGSLSQEEINALFNQIDSTTVLSIKDFLSPLEQDALGELGNISLGSSTTALSTLLNQRVEITTPTLAVIEWERMEESIKENQVAVHVDYTSGIRGKNLLMIKEKDAKIIADLMMGGEGIPAEGNLSELHLSAVQEAMNQMMGSAATSMSTLFNQKVDISPPTVDVLGVPPKKVEDLNEEIIIEVSFKLKVGSLIDSNMVQFIPLSVGKEMIHKLLNPGEAPVPEPATVQQQVQPQIQPIMNTAPVAPVMQPEPAPAAMVPPNTNVQRVEYATFAEHSVGHASKANIDLLYDIPLAITVELGRTQMPIKKILELGPGSVIQLDKLAGEPVDILANNKLIAKGEVVVIEENFGVRITDIVSPIDRISKMTN
ncbi:flagellar motor switch phosphatase FliY [Bacillus sp. EB01]|uniref:flagellar motor switch phosphatase FliY n=1 Tax=Bacillus sp. EB01 TaxID=1347086 RepID=UPI0005C630C3|nr:flagellar motor switch phosphatase FliY [Bacillus sp. EB01]